MDELIKNMRYTLAMENYSAIKKNNNLPFITTWTNLEGIVGSKVIPYDSLTCVN